MFFSLTSVGISKTSKTQILILQGLAFNLFKVQLGDQCYLGSPAATSLPLYQTDLINYT